MTSDLKLDILGTSFTITVEEDEAYLNKVLLQYNAAVKNTQSISGIKDPLNVAVLTGFLLCDEINKIKTRTESESVEVQERTVRLIAELDKALKVCIKDE
ncbi:MAG: cell division protein ZapA [Treponema sp.]|nr:cell division protein ZapA [Treponema sp.]